MSTNRLDNNRENNQQDDSQTDTPLADIKIGFVTSQWAKSQNLPVQYSPALDSTNNWAKKEAFIDTSFNENLIVYLTEKQSAGRGRGQNTWSNANLGSQLFSTWSFLVEEFPQPSVTPRIGLALYRACHSTWPFLNWSLKSPNDLFLNEKKVAGLLVETIQQGDDLRLLVGLGINVFDSPEDIATATHILENLPSALPFLAEDWITFLERFLYELSLAIQSSPEALDTTTQKSLLYALNLNPHVKVKFTQLNQNGEPS